MKHLLVIALLSPVACVGAVEDLADEPAPAPSGAPAPAAAPGQTPPTSAPPPPGAPAASCRTGATPLRRLTRTEYDNTVRQLLGITGTPSEGLPPDEVPEGYDTDVAHQGVSPLLAAGYLKAAESVAARVSLTAILPCAPAALDDACARAFVERFGRRAYRRPLRPAESTQLVAFLRDAAARHGSEAGVRLTIQLFLSSPQFLYRLELTAAGPGQVARLTPHEVASRLSYSLWGTMPDEALFAAADAGQLVTREQVARHAERMLADPRAAAQLRRFADQWLMLHEIDEVRRDARVYRGWADRLTRAMATEAVTFVAKVALEENGGYEQLLTAPHSYLNAELATYLGVPPPAGTGFARVELDPTRHSGLLTLSGPLAINSTAERGNPIYRGRWVRRQLLCTDVPPPPPAVMVDVPDLGPGASAREQLAQHSAEPACAGCHRLLDPVGFGFERFDATGKWRATEGGRPIDTRGELVAAGDASGPFDGAVELGRRLGRSQEAAGCLATQLFRFSRGRRETPEDECALATARARLGAAGGNLRALLVAMTQTDDFLLKAGAPAGGP